MRIQRVHIGGFRSLQDVELSGLQDFTVIFGDNNTGKSNILAFLEVLFSAKLEAPETTAMQDLDAPPARRGNWKRGEISDFSDNFFRNTSAAVTFDVDILLSDEDVAEVLCDCGGPGALANKIDVTAPLSAAGTITKATGDKAIMVVHTLKWGAQTIYEDVGGHVRLFPDIAELPTEVQTAVDSGLNVLLNDSVVVINSQRFLIQEEEDHSSGTEFKSEQFKNALHNLFMDRETYHVFAEIARWFSETPFGYGNLGFARIQSERRETIELMVEKGGLRLPVDRMGSGVQQTLLIIANLVGHTSKRVFLIEEPEVNLSPQSQLNLFRRLWLMLRQGNTHVDQLVVTSHSPVFGEQRQARVIHVSLEGGATVVTRAEDTGSVVAAHFESLVPVVNLDYCPRCDLDKYMPGANDRERDDYRGDHICPGCRILRTTDPDRIAQIRLDVIQQYGARDDHKALEGG